MNTRPHFDISARQKPGRGRTILAQVKSAQPQRYGATTKIRKIGMAIGDASKSPPPRHLVVSPPRCVAASPCRRLAVSPPRRVATSPPCHTADRLLETKRRTQEYHRVSPDQSQTSKNRYCFAMLSSRRVQFILKRRKPAMLTCTGKYLRHPTECSSYQWTVADSLFNWTVADLELVGD